METIGVVGEVRVEILKSKERVKNGKSEEQVEEREEGE